MSFLKWLLLIAVFIHHQPLNHALSAQDSTNFWKAVKSNVLNGDCDMEPLLAAVLGLDWRTIEYIRAETDDHAFRERVKERIEWEEMLAMSYISILQSLNIAIEALNVPFVTVNIGIDLINGIPLNLGIPDIPHLDITVAINFALHGLFDAIPELAGFDLPDFKLPSMNVDGLVALNYDLQLALGKWTGLLLDSILDELEHRDHFRDELVRKAEDASTWLPQFWRPMIEDIVGILNDVGLFGSVTSAIINQTGLAVIWGGNIQILYNGAKISLNKGYGFAMNLEGRYELIEMRGLETEFKILEVPTAIGTFCYVYLIKDIDEFVNKQKKYGAGVRLTMPSKEDSMEKDESARRRLLSVCDPSSDPSIGYYDQCFDLQQQYNDNNICVNDASRTSTFTTDEQKRYKKNKGLLDKVWKKAKTYMGPGWRITYDLLKKVQMLAGSGDTLALSLGIQGNVNSYGLADVFSFSCDSIAFDMQPRPYNWTVYINRNKFAKYDEFGDGMVDFELSEFTSIRRRLQSHDFGDVSVHRFTANDPVFEYPSNALNDWIWRNQGSLGSDYDLNYTKSACDNKVDIIDVNEVNSLCDFDENLNFTLNISSADPTTYSAVSFEIYVYKTTESTVNNECIGAGAPGIFRLITNDNIELVSDSVSALDNTWTHVVFVGNDLYINKVTKPTTQTTPTPVTSPTPAPVPSNNLRRVQLFGDFKACVSNARVFNRSLDASEIDALYDAFTVDTSPEAKIIDKHIKEKGFLQGIDDFFDDPINKFVDIFDDIFEIGFKAMKEVGQELFGAMKDGVLDVITKVTNVFTDITNAFDKLLDKLNVIYAVKKMLQGIKTVLDDVTDNLDDAIDDLKSAQKALEKGISHIENSFVNMVSGGWLPKKIKVTVAGHTDSINLPKYFQKEIKKEMEKIVEKINLKQTLKPVQIIINQIRRYLKHMGRGIKIISKRLDNAIDSLKKFEDDTGTDDVVSTDTVITSQCDNVQTISMSKDGGASFSQIGYVAAWPTPFTYTLPRLTVEQAAKTVFRFDCKNEGGVGGFIASVQTDGTIYSTTNPIEKGFFSTVSSSLVYTAKGSGPWDAVSDKIASDAHWIWDGSTTVGTTLQFDFSLSEVRKVFLQCKHELTVSLSIDGGFSFNVIATNDDIAWNSAYESKTWSYSLTSLNNEQIRNTVLKFSCKATVYTGFIASVYYGGKVYSTSPRAGDGAFTTSSAVTYSRDHGSVSTPTIDKIAASDAFWVWPVVAADPVEFVLDLGAVIASAKPKYYFGHQRMIYMDAKYHCMLYFGAPLATIHSINDNINVMESMNNSDSVCIGRYNNKWDDGGIESEWNNYAKVTSPYQVTSHCDNVQTISLSTDGGNTFTVIGAAAANDDWHDPFLYIGSEATADTVLRFMCENNIVSSAGGFIATVSVDDHQYSTSNPSNPLDAGYFEFVSSTPSTVSTFSYASKTSAPWSITTASIASDAYWIWDATLAAKTMTFDFNFGKLFDDQTNGCVHMDNDGVWHTHTCDTRKTFICQSDGTRVPRRGYVLVDQQKSRADAETYCATYYQSHLATVHWQQDNDILKNIVNPPVLLHVASHCDNAQTISLSNDGGNTFATIIGPEEENDDWTIPFRYTVLSASDDTVLRFECVNTIVTSYGGFVATVSVNRHQYSTSNPLSAGHFQFVSSTPSTVSTFSYASKTSAPWGITTASIASDAFWIWDATPDASRTTKSMTFDFHVSADMLPAQKDAWIGYQTKPTIAEFGAWCDGSTDNYTNWANTPPSPATGKGCFIQADGKWEDSDSGNTKPFVCDIVGDYVIVDQSKPFDDAQTYCKTTYGTSLASVHTASQNQFLYDLKQKQSESNDIWIGLRKQSADARHWFVDGTDHWDSAFFWDDVSPDRDDGCAVMKVDGTWNDVSCTTPYRFACNVKPHVPYMFVDLKVSSSEAADHCNKTFNTALATIANRYQNDILSDLIGTDHVWIGLRRTNFVTFPIDLSKALDVLESGQNSWIWMEQSNKIYDTEWNVALDNISFTNWESGYPEDVFTCTAKTNAFMKGGSGGEWKNGCTSNRKFACNNPVEHSDVQMDDTTGDGESQYDDHFELVLETENGGLDIGYNDFMLKFIYPMGEIEERDMWIIKRECLDCVYTYEIIYYRRYTVDSSTSYWHPANIYGFMKDKWESPNNVMGVNFNIYSTYEDAINDNRDNAWKYCNTFDVTGVAAFGDCAPSLSEYVPNQWNGVNGKDASFYIHRKKPVERDVKRIKNIWSKIKRVGFGSAADASPPLIDRRDEASNDSPLINRRDEPSHEVYSYYDYYVVSIVGFITGCVFVYVVMYLCDCLEKKEKNSELLSYGSESVC
eukprot:24542_1